MFLQETKTKRGGKTYVSYLVRESFRTANGPRGRTICNLTHLPKEVRDMVRQALRGKSLVPVDRLEVNNIHSFGGCVVLEDAARRYRLPESLAPLAPRSGALVRAMIFGGLLTAPSVAPFHMGARTARLAMFCGLDPEKERFDAADLTAALRELDERWKEVCGLLSRPPQPEVRAIAVFKVSHSGKRVEMSALGMDAEGIPVPLMQEEAGADAVTAGLPQRMASQQKGGRPLFMLDEEVAARMNVERAASQPWLVELTPESLVALLRQLNQAQLLHALRTGGPVEVRHHGKRHILTPAGKPREAAESQVRMGSLKELTSLAAGSSPETAVAARPPHAGAVILGAFHGVTTNLPPERLSAAAAMAWARRARAARAAFSPVQIVMGRPASGEGVPMWRNHRNLQFLTHRLRCQLHAEWSARGETRPVEDVLLDLQEVHRATLTVDGVVVRRLATHPSEAVASLLARLNLWNLFETPGGGRKERPRNAPSIATRDPARGCGLV